MKRIIVIAGLTVGLCGTALAQEPTVPITPAADGLAGFFVNQYPWLATVLLVIGGLRVIFKPIMALVDGYVKANCSAEEYARLQSFEAGPVYRWLCFGLDFVGSVKLPVIGLKPPPKT